MPSATLIKTVRQAIEQHALIRSHDCVVVGVSGGADSMALLHVLAAINDSEDHQWRLHVAHLNHGLRGDDSDADAGFVEAAADGLRLPRSIHRCDIRDIASREKGSVEEIARGERYAFFERVALAEGANAVAVGHHADDNAETILHRILRGTGLRGVSGIRVARPLSGSGDLRLIRPLLGARRDDIFRYIESEGVIFREDATNVALEATRNVIRNQLIPQIARQINPQVVTALLRLGEQAGWVEAYLRETAHRTLDTLIIARTDQELTLNAAALARKSRIVQTELIREAILLFQLGEQHLSFGHINGVAEMVNDGRTGKTLSLPGDMTATLAYDRLILAVRTEQPRETIAPVVAVHLPGETLLTMRHMRIECEVADAPRSGDLRPGRHSRFEEWMDLDSVHPPLSIRSRQSGDRFHPLGAPGSKSIADYLSDAKIDRAERDRAAVLCDQLGPIWLIGHRIDDRVRLTRLTRRVLRIRVTNI